MTPKWEPLEVRRPTPPEAMTFCFIGEVDPIALRYARTNAERQVLFDRLKRQAARELADFIFEKCKLFESRRMDRDGSMEMELTISDRGAYVHYVREADALGHERGRKQAIKQMVESLPYGMADAAQEFYE